MLLKMQVSGEQGRHPSHEAYVAREALWAHWTGPCGWHAVEKSRDGSRAVKDFSIPEPVVVILYVNLI